MKVEELIEELKKCNPENKVLFFVGPDFNEEYDLKQIQSDKKSAVTGIYLD